MFNSVRYTFLIICLFSIVVIPLEIKAQNYELDTTFISEYKFRDVTSFAWENKTGGIVNVILDPYDRPTLFGLFKDPYSSYWYQSHLRLSTEGLIDHTFCQNLGGYQTFSAKKNGDFINIFQHLYVGKMDIYTGELDTVFEKNTERWTSISDLEPLPDGGFLVSGGVIYKLDSVTNLYTNIARINSNGTYDTTFFHDVDLESLDLLRYDEDRVLVAGKFTQYDSHPVNHLIRIYNDGTLDTTFNSIFSSPPVPIYVDEDGKTIVGGYFFIEGCPYFLGMVRINADGSLDSTFNNFNNMKPNGELWTDPFTQYNRYESYVLRTVCPTPNNKYLIGGYFINYQGYPAKRLALIDEYGYLDTLSPLMNIDTCYECDDFICVHDIVPIGNDRYYVAGKFAGYEGHEVEPIIRIYNADNSVKEIVTPEFELFPNPASEKITLTLPAKSLFVTVHDITGSMIYSSQIEQGSIEYSINCKAWQNGTYLCTIETKKGVKVSSYFVVMK